MGTSRSSSGSPSNVPMVPPWVPEVPTSDRPEVEPTNDQEPEAPQDDQPEVDVAPTQDGIDLASPSPTPAEKVEPETPSAAPPPGSGQVPIAPSRRFASTRRPLGTFAVSGDRRSMRRGVREYVRTGLGGAGTAARRFGGTARTAASLYSTLGGSGAPAPGAAGPLDGDLLVGRSARDVIDAVIEAACPVDGSLDAEASRESINDAMAELVDRFPEVDLLRLTEDQREFVVERFVGLDVFRRFVLDVGKTILEKAPSPTTALARLKEVREYIRETIAAAFRKLRSSGQRLTRNRVDRVVKQALGDAFDVFSGYVE